MFIPGYSVLVLEPGRRSIACVFPQAEEGCGEEAEVCCGSFSGRRRKSVLLVESARPLWVILLRREKEEEEEGWIQRADTLYKVQRHFRIGSEAEGVTEVNRDIVVVTLITLINEVKCQ